MLEHHRAIVLVSISLLLICFTPARAVTLKSLLADMPDSADVMAAGAKVDQLRGERRQRADERGWSVFGSVDAGYLQELEADRGTVDYTGYGMEVGLRYPLLGTLRQRNEALIESQLAVERQRSAQLIQRAEQRLFLRNAYIDWWETQQLLKLCERLEPLAEKELAAARQRAAGNNLRRSELMWLEQRWQVRLKSCQNLPRREAILRARLARLSGMPLPVASVAEATPLTEGPTLTSRWSDVIGGHPAVATLRRQLNVARKQQGDHWLDRVNSNFTIAQRIDRRSDLSGTGTGLVVGLSFEVPLAALTGDHQDGSSDAGYRVAMEELRGTRNQLRKVLEDTLYRYESAVDEAISAQQQAALAAQLESERYGRAQVDGEAGFMALRTARIEQANGAVDLIRAWRNAWQEQAELMLIADYGDLPDSLPGARKVIWPGTTSFSSMDSRSRNGSEPAGADPVWIKAAYVWDSGALLSAQTRIGELNELKASRFNRIYLGLSAEQLKHLASLESQVAELVRDAEAMGMAVDILLGDPAWIKSEYRNDLVELIEQLRSLPFERLLLDLEVEQLQWPVPDELIQDWIRTLRAAVKVSPWPVSLVSHHRWFAPGQSGARCVPCVLPNLGIEQVSLMIYTTNEARMKSLSGGISQGWPELTFAVAQSVEPDLPSANSWYGHSASSLNDKSETWRGRLSPLGIAGLEWQDWSSYPEYEAGGR
ncbi:TolC family protein [Marinobacter orientalis]|uniref:Outer membrane protein TolC n=1 Tax=Marinobacter orientalis TaxID=1928859 RepID=A0A7Y0RCR7_9GAMM|nr:hypothetical protein [Marinobacter orientalis]NMT63839.1 hypothetical protein [Marinobacter orientalis]TGX49941.1 hypothetical protein DIT72_09550 [Marinobacter orientalis]